MNGLKKALALTLALVLAASLAVFASAEAQPASGPVITYDPSLPVNNGDPIEVEFWYWTGSANLFQSLADKYTAIHPNVTVKLVENPWSDYWTKLPLALQGDSGPAIFNVHNSYHENLIGYMAPYDISAEDLDKEFVGVSAHVIGGKVYYIDYSMMTASIYYNTDMWAAAGLTEKDIPKTWEQFREVAKKLTIREGDTLVQAGFNYNGGLQGKVVGIGYQYGENLFKADNTANLDNEAMRTAIQMFVDMYKVDGVCNNDFGNDSGETFGQGKTAMIADWGFMRGVFQQNYPDLHYGVFELPTPTEDTPYAYFRYNGESTFGVNKNAPASQQAVAQDIIRYFLANDEIEKEFCLQMATFPAKKSLAKDADLMAIPSIAVLGDHIDRYIWPGPMPGLYEDNVKIMLQDILYNGVDVGEALKKAEATINEELANTGFVSLEPLYKYAAEAAQR